MMRKPKFFERSELTAALWSFRREFGAVALFSAASNLMLLVPTLYMLQVYDRVLVSRNDLTLLAVSLITLFLFLVLAFSEWSRSRVLVRAGVRLDEHLSTRVFNSSFDAYLAQAGNGPSRAFSDLLNVRQFLTGQGIFAFFDAPWTPIYIVVTFMLHPWLGVAAIVFCIIQGSLGVWAHRQSVAPADAASRAGQDVNAYLQSKLRNAEVIEAMGMLDNLRRRWRRWQDTYLSRAGEAQAINDRVTSFSKFIRYTLQSLSLAAGALLVARGELSPGAMIAANLLMGRALAPIDQLVGSWRSFLTARTSFERLEKLMAEYPERDPNLSRVAPRGDVELRGVIASAPGRQEPILKELSFAVPAGSVVAVLGPSGSGKSTLARVLVGIWPQVSGEVLLDGLPLDGWNRTELGPHLGYLPQDIELLEGSIAENIARFGEVDSDKVIEAARLTGLHEMILRFPKGYDTPIGEAGRLLSGGQRQRIGLARAAYGNPVMLVLDEPNANLDDVGEAALYRSLQQLKAAGKTVFIITHRPGALSLADRLLLLQEGRVRAYGTPQEVAAILRPAPTRDEPPAPGLDSLQPA
jgi:ATP-binding cassette subfamily C exporter for protease/lipase